MHKIEVFSPVSLRLRANYLSETIFLGTMDILQRLPPNNVLSTHAWFFSSNLAEVGWLFSFGPAFTLGSLALWEKKSWEVNRQS